MTDLNKERELYKAAKKKIEKEEFFCRDWDLWKACAELKQSEINELKVELEKAKAQAVPEHIITLQRNGEVFKFDLLDLLRRSLKSSKVLKTRENWSHVSKMVGLGSTTSTLLCKEMNVDPDGTVFVASESGAEG